MSYESTVTNVPSLPFQTLLRRRIWLPDPSDYHKKTKFLVFTLEVKLPFIPQRDTFVIISHRPLGIPNFWVKDISWDMENNLLELSTESDDWKDFSPEGVRKSLDVLMEEGWQLIYGRLPEEDAPCQEVPS